MVWAEVGDEKPLKCTQNPCTRPPLCPAVVEGFLDPQRAMKLSDFRNLNHFPLNSKEIQLDSIQIGNRNIYCTAKCDFPNTEPHKKINQIALESHLSLLFHQRL